jgi:hypothetical protein
MLETWCPMQYGQRLLDHEASNLISQCINLLMDSKFIDHGERVETVRGRS